ncbi:DUF4055 domain-containing protein [Undibacterium sp. SXout7W]|uniref:DUF4055 domain-containing protein n=1 Tax=Undibacterium sp. SXout7W TaxID=3413049 RepID=UPI003BF0DFC9
MSVSTKHSDYLKYQKKWERCRDASAGQDAVHEKGVKYLPRLKEQSQDDYDAYRDRAVFYNATWRTITGLQGMMFRKPPKIEASETIKELFKDITATGINLQTFALDVAENALMVGRHCVFVDYPKSNAKTLADQKNLALRPNLVSYKAEQFINWRTERVDNATVLSLAVLEEKAEEVDSVDRFTVTEKMQYRVLELVNGIYNVSVYEKDKDDKDVLIEGPYQPQMNGKPMNFIPFFCIGVDDTDTEIDEPPLIDLVDMNLAHYRTTADYEHGCHFTGLPTPVVTGYTPETAGEKLYIGSQAAWVFPSPDADAKYLEFSGGGLTFLENNLKNKENMMAVLGARMLEQTKRGVESAEVAAIHRSGEQSVLASIAQTISIGLESALEVLAQWAGSEEDIEFELNRDFHPMPLDANMLNALVNSWQRGAISYPSLFAKLKMGEVIDADVTVEEEQAKLSTQEPVLTGGAGGRSADPITADTGGE